MPIFPDLTQRRREPEVMDDPGLDAQRHVAALRGLSRLNGLSASISIIWKPILQLARQTKADRLRILDVASGAGDLPLKLWKRAQRAGLPLEIHGVDISPRAVEYASRQAQAMQSPVTFEQRDVLKSGLPSGFDVVMSSLFLHHLDPSDAVQLLRMMAAAAGRLVLINDLRRNLPGWLLAYTAGRLFTRSDVVHVDGPLSVQAAFTMSELKDLATSAGLESVSIQRRWPCRMLMAWQRPEPG